MKTMIVSVMGILAAVAIGFGVFGENAKAQTGARYAPAPGTPPIGSVCEVRVLASILSARTEIEVVRGNMLAMTTEWVVLKEGSFENWVPRDKIITLRASR